MTRIIEETNYPSDIIHYIKEALVNESGVLRSPVALEDVEILGQPTKVVGGVRELVLAGDEANATGLVYTKFVVSVAAGATTEMKVAHSVRGPLILNKTRFPETDVAGDPFDIDALATAYSAMGDVAVKEEAAFQHTFTQLGNF